MWNDDNDAPNKGVSPTPWQINEACWVVDSMGVTPPPILDRHGKPILHTSEWITMSRENAELIVAAVNGDIIDFDPVEKFEGAPIENGHVVFTGPCPLDGITLATNIRSANGRLLRVAGEIYRIIGVDTFSKVTPPHRGEPVGIKCVPLSRPT